MKNYFFSIIIPTLNEEENLPLLLNSIKNQSYIDFEVIICDNFSKDKTKKIALSFKKEINLKFLQKKFTNVSQARNFGAKQAKGEYLIFFDADVEIENNFLKMINYYLNKYNLDLLTVWNRSKKSLKGKFIFGLMNFAMSFSVRFKPAMNGPCMIIKKEKFFEVDGFDEEIVFGEDFDITQRLVKAGGKFMVFKKPILYVSTRRFDKEGLIKSLSKSIKAIFYQQFFGPIKKPIFEYEMGGQYYKNSKIVSVSRQEKNKNAKNNNLNLKKNQLRTKYEISAGGIVYKKLKIKNQKLKIEWLIVQHSQHKGWVFPKGLIGDKMINEKMEEAALREVEEEGGVKAKIVYDRPIKVEYTYRFKNYLVKKKVYYFLMEYISGDPKNHDWEVSDGKFVSENEVKKILTYKSDKEAFEKMLLIFKQILSTNQQFQ